MKTQVSIERELFFEHLTGQVEVFITNIYTKEEAGKILYLLKKCFPDYQINFDLEDCDKILRIESGKWQIVDTQAVMALVRNKGFNIAVLP